MCRFKLVVPGATGVDTSLIHLVIRYLLQRLLSCAGVAHTPCGSSTCEVVALASNSVRENSILIHYQFNAEIENFATGLSWITVSNESPSSFVPGKALLVITPFQSQIFAIFKLKH